MKLMVPPDWRDDLSSLSEIGEALTRVDVVLLVGDLTNDGRKMRFLIKWNDWRWPAIREIID